MPIKVQSNASGSGIFTLINPNSSTSRTVTLPDATTTLVGTDSTQTLTNKTIQGGTIQSVAIQGGVLTFQSPITMSSATVINFTTIPSWVKRVTLIFASVSTNGTSNMLVQLGTSAGYETTGYLGSAASPSGTLFTDGFGVSTGTGAATVVHGQMAITNLGGNTWVAGLSGGYSNAGAPMTGGGSKTLAGTLDRVRFTTQLGTDTFDSGTINIIYEG